MEIDVEFYLGPCLCSDEVKMWKKAVLPSRGGVVEMTPPQFLKKGPFFSSVLKISGGRSILINYFGKCVNTMI